MTKPITNTPFIRPASSPVNSRVRRQTRANGLTSVQQFQDVNARDTTPEHKGNLDTATEQGFWKHNRKASNKSTQPSSKASSDKPARPRRKPVAKQRIQKRTRKRTQQHAGASIQTPSRVKSSAIDLRALTKRYGARTVVRSVSLKVAAGSIYALVGANGAGKTTIMRMATGLAYPTAGQVRLLGQNPFEDARIKQHIGAVVEAPAAFYPYLSGRANLQLHARLLGKRSRAKGRLVAMLDRLELLTAADQKVATYSLGMRQRLGLAAALLGDPKVLMLDEPASGIDPLSVNLIYQVLKEASADGCAVLLSTHHLDDVTDYCDVVGMLDAGSLVREVPLAPLRHKYRAHVSHAAKAAEALTTWDGVSDVQQEATNVTFSTSERRKLGQVSFWLAKARVALYDLQPVRFDLKRELEDAREQAQLLKDDGLNNKHQHPKASANDFDDNDFDDIDDLLDLDDLNLDELTPDGDTLV
ncbi:MAG: ABC transporter ATP-binding protein [Deinococcota bacterium]